MFNFFTNKNKQDSDARLSVSICGIPIYFKDFSKKEEYMDEKGEKGDIVSEMKEPPEMAAMESDVERMRDRARGKTSDGKIIKRNGTFIHDKLVEDDNENTGSSEPLLEVTPSAADIRNIGHVLHLEAMGYVVITALCDIMVFFFSRIGFSADSTMFTRGIAVLILGLTALLPWYFMISFIKGISGYKTAKAYAGTVEEVDIYEREVTRRSLDGNGNLPATQTKRNTYAAVRLSNGRLQKYELKYGCQKSIKAGDSVIIMPLKSTLALVKATPASPED